MASWAQQSCYCEHFLRDLWPCRVPLPTALNCSCGVVWSCGLECWFHKGMISLSARGIPGDCPECAIWLILEVGAPEKGACFLLPRVQTVTTYPPMSICFASAVGLTWCWVLFGVQRNVCFQPLKNLIQLERAHFPPNTDRLRINVAITWLISWTCHGFEW